MPPARISLLSLALLILTACSGNRGADTSSTTTSQTNQYVPQAQFCVEPNAGSPLCSIVPGNIGNDPPLGNLAYNGIVGVQVTSPDNDAQTPFDNLSWQTFVALNWTKGKESQPAQEGLQGHGSRVWESWPRVADVFGNGKVRASCAVPPGLTVFQIASNGNKEPVGQNEEYIQAATGDPAIDVTGNWTIYERRLNDLEVAYLEAPNGNTRWNLATWDGQKRLIADGGTVDFPSIKPGAPTGAIEIKAAWRVLDPAERAANQQKFYVVPAMLTVAPDLVVQEPGKPPAPICARVDLGLVAMHIIQKNVANKALKPQWFWSTFEHVDNAPLAKQRCDPADPEKCATLGQLECPAQPDPKTTYSYFNKACPDPDCKTNQPPTQSPWNPAFAWNPTRPYAKAYLRTTKSGGQTVTVGTQISRCWSIYSLTDQLNAQWRGQLRQIGSVFQHYMLVGTQWGASLTSTPVPRIPFGVVPNFLSNSVVETYLQTKADTTDPFNNGSCVTCHNAATLPADQKTPANLSFLPSLVQPNLVRRKPIPPATQ